MKLTVEQEQLVMKNLGLAYHMAKRYHHQYMSQDDIGSWGVVGLIEASRRFDASKGFKFATFASTCINNRLIKVCFRDKSRHDTSLNQVMDENGVELIEFFATDEDVESEVSLSIDVRSALNQLSDRERFVIEKRYGLSGQRTLNHTEVGALINLTQMTISRIEREALAKMRKILSKEGE